MTETINEHLMRVNEPKEPWSIKTDKDADWVARVIIHHQITIADRKKMAEEQRQQIDAWFAETTHDAQQSIASMSERLRAYLVTRLELEKSKTLKLPSGAVSLRTADTEFTIKGENAGAESPELLEFAKRSAVEFLKIKETVAWGELKKTLIATKDGRVITNDGEILDFMAAYQPPDKITVKGMK